MSIRAELPDASRPGAARRLSRWLVRSRGYEYLAAPAIALAVLCAAFAVRGIYPFGDLSVAIWDMDIQYVGFFGWLSNVMHGEGSLLYSFSQGMGEGTAALVAYYLASPFNLLAWFFEPKDAPQLMSLLTLLKLTCAALTCYAFLRARFRPGTVHVLLSVAYALCGYTVAQCSNIMWMDGVIMLPLVALGTWRLVCRGSCLALFASVAAAVTFNWYTGYMDCLFSVLYFFVCWLGLPKGERRVSVGGRYAATMALGVGASLAVFLPAVLGLLATKEGGGSLVSNLLHLRFSYNPSNLMGSFALTATPASDWDRMAPLYTSALAVMLAGSFLMNGRAERRERALAGAMLALLAVSICVSPLDVLWSGLKPATSYFFRYAYVVSFAVVLVAAQGAEALSGLAARERLAATLPAALLACLLIGLAVVNVRLNTRSMLVSAAALAATFALLVGYSLLAGAAAGARRRAALVAVAAVLVLEQGVNAASVFSHYGRDVHAWGDYVESLSAAYACVPRGAAGTRVAQLGFSFWGEGRNVPTTSEGFVMGVSGLSEYTSTMGSPMVDLLTRLGYSGTNEIFGYYYRAHMTATDALLGVGYTVSRDRPPAGELVCALDEAPYAGYSLWRNTLAMPAAYGIRAGAGSAAWSEEPFDNTEALARPDLLDTWQGFALVKNPFANQEALFADASGTDASGLYVAATAEERTDAATATSRSWEVSVAQDGPLYLHIPLLATLRQGCAVSVGGTEVATVGGNFDNSVIYLGEHAAGEVLEVGVRLLPVATTGQSTLASTAGKVDAAAQKLLAGSSTSDLVVAETLDTGRLAELLGSLDSDAATVESWEDGHVRLRTSADRDETLLTVIPYDSGWRATVDGATVEVRRLYEGLCGVDLPAGEHTVEFTYETPGLVAGAAGSVASVAAFALWRGVARRRRG